MNSRAIRRRLTPNSPVRHEQFAAEALPTLMAVWSSPSESALWNRPFSALGVSAAPFPPSVEVSSPPYGLLLLPGYRVIRRHITGTLTIVQIDVGIENDVRLRAAVPCQTDSESTTG